MKNKPFWSVKNLSEGTEKEEIEVKVYGEIVNIPCWDGDVSANSLKREIDKYPNAKKISVRINSPGGDVFEAQAIYNILKNHPAEVEVHIDALAASAATLIASAGNKIIMYNNALFMIHNPWTWATGEEKDFIKKANLLATIKETLLNVYETHATATREEISNMMNEETWLTADEALSYGLIHEVVPCKAKEEDVEEVQNFVREQIMGNYKNFPKDKFKNLFASLKEPKNSIVALSDNENTEENEEEEVVMNSIEELKEKYPEIYNQAIKQGVEEGTIAERARLQSIDNLKGDSTILNKAKYEEPKNAGEVAIEINAKNEEERNKMLNDVKNKEKLGASATQEEIEDKAINEELEKINNKR